MTDATAAFSIAEMLRGYSIEVNPSQPKVVDAALERMQAGHRSFPSLDPGRKSNGCHGPCSQAASRWPCRGPACRRAAYRVPRPT